MFNTRIRMPHMDNYVCDLTTHTQLDTRSIFESPSIQHKSCCFYPGTPNTHRRAPKPSKTGYCTGENERRFDA